MGGSARWASRLVTAGAFIRAARLLISAAGGFSQAARLEKLLEEAGAAGGLPLIHQGGAATAGGRPRGRTGAGGKDLRGSKSAAAFPGAGREAGEAGGGGAPSPDSPSGEQAAAESEAGARDAVAAEFEHAMAGGGGRKALPTAHQLNQFSRSVNAGRRRRSIMEAAL